MKVVIGGAYGDEGKGKVVDEYAASVTKPMVVRSHSSGQCSHTVVVDDKRHVFGHVGSGSFAGAPTYFGRNFVHNPLVLMKELAKLKSIGVTPELYSDPFASVTLPHDILLNRVLEQTRDSKHGSCGIGYGVSVERSMSPEHWVQIRDLKSISVKDLMEIGDDWARIYLEKHPYAKEAYYASKHRDSFETLLKATKDGIKGIILVRPGELASGYELIYEGAQGLLLDETYGTMPYVTWGDCGIMSPLNTIIGRMSENDKIEINYVLRSYLTRHGNGPMFNEISYKKIEETTNKYNAYQGEFRFGVFDFKMLDAIKLDSAKARLFKPSLVLTITCMDQMNGSIPVISFDNKVTTYDEEIFMHRLQRELPGWEIRFKYGPERNK